jgi:transcriptional regulator with XRE-family HTH domain
MSDAFQQTGKIPPSVAVDGTRVRTIREEKRLTQLYVASVVGVTTDTISRWENNRYPTIKGDNAVKLADALEVTLSEILRQEEVLPPADEPTEPEVEAVPPPSRRRYLLLSLPILGLILIALLLVRPWEEDISAVRKLPYGTAPGMLLPVQIGVERGDTRTGGVIVREQLPQGWVLAGAAPPTAGQSTTGEVKWLLPGGSSTTVISYTVRVPAEWPLGKRAAFDGRIAVEKDGLGNSTAIAGDRECEVNSHHWADADGDGRIDDREIMPAYYLTEEMKSLLADWPLVESIWSARGYEWDPQRREYKVVR